MKAERLEFPDAFPALAAMDDASRLALSAACEFQTLPGGARLLRQGYPNTALHFLLRGTVAVRVQRDHHRETIAELDAPAIVGELSVITGRLCSADVEAVGSVETAVLPAARLTGLGATGEALLRALLPVIAARLHDAVRAVPPVARARVVWLRADEAFPARLAFATELCAGLSEAVNGPTLLVADGLGEASGPTQLDGFPFATCAPAESGRLTERLAAWRDAFRFTVILGGADPPGPPDAVDVVGDLLAGGPPLPPTTATRTFVAADAARAQLPRLTGTSQLLFDTDAAAEAFRTSAAMPPRFSRTARSLARAVRGCQVGLALGGGGACCWAHIGLLSVLEQARIPVDVVAGCSMGSLVGALLSSGRTVADITDIAEYWRTRYRRMIELRFWQLHAVSERGLEKALAGYFGTRQLPTLEIPFCANAVDIQTGEEVILDRMPVAQAVRASMALPGSWPPLDLGDQVLVDAAIMAPVPVGPVRQMGADFVIAMNVMPSMVPGPIRRWNPMRFYDVLQRSLRICGHQVGNNRTSGADIMLTPALERHSLADFAACREIIRIGTEEAARHQARIVSAYEQLVDARA